MTFLITAARSPWLAWGAVALYVLLLTHLLLSSQPLAFLGRAGTLIDESVDRTLISWGKHIIAYAVLAGLLVWATWTSTGPRLRISLLLAFGHGAVTEWLQSFVPGRHATFWDVLANACGVGVVVAILAVASYRGWRIIPKREPTRWDQQPVNRRTVGTSSRCGSHLTEKWRA